MEGYHDISDESSETSDSSLDHTSSTDEHQDFDESSIDDENAPIITEHDVKKGGSEFGAAFPCKLLCLINSALYPTYVVDQNYCLGNIFHVVYI